MISNGLNGFPVTVNWAEIPVNSELSVLTLHK